MRLKKCFLYIYEERAEAVVVEKNRFEKTSVFEGMRADGSQEELWTWFVGAVDYKKSKEVMALCVVGDCSDFQFQTDQIFWAQEQGAWAEEEIINCLNVCYQQNAYELVDEKIAKTIVVPKAQQGWGYAETRKMNLFLSGPLVAVKVEEEKTEPKEGRLYEYYNGKTKEYENRKTRYSVPK